MLTLTNYTVSQELLQEAQSQLPTIDNRLSLNQPTGEFFYEPWIVKPEYRGTIWEEILNSLPLPKGEARLIKLVQGECYPSHADVDDRWHINLTGNNSFIIDLEKQQMYQTNQLGHWYDMNAGVRHTAANFGSEDRVQLVIRQLLPRASITNPKQISIKLKTVVGDRRFIFDDVISPWLNRAFKQGIVSNFVGQDLEATFIIEESHIAELDKLVNQHFTLTIK
jgi:hypothetical protein